uniref:FAD-binding domain-containing protein n=1 Tax=Vannella robusta TaxID=1487602 RepID=A0A7S4M3H8_9EUKA|mmetsp:Transcript_10164/g.12552  ORF Transcript_10164/g.12552 Transcript_10164/m.12552 type:complete len:419 (+) Transcript_10164:79-1335(+)
MHVAVVGAGPGGLMAAYRLQSEGIKVTVVERKPLEDLCADIGGAYDISGNSRKVFEAVGLGKEFDALQGQMKGFVMINSQDGSKFKELQLGDGFLAGLRRSEIQQLFMNALDTSVFKCGSAFESYEETELGVKIKLENNEEFCADFLIAADGIRSSILKQIFPQEYKEKLRFAQCIAYWGFFDYNPKTDSDVMLPHLGLSVLGPGLMIGGGLHGDGKEAVWAAILQRTEPSHSKEVQDSEVIKQEVLEEVKNVLPATIPRVMEKTEATKIFKVHVYDRDPLDCWHKGRVVLLGDAAHAMNPFAGQGANMAIIDGFLLGSLISSLSKNFEDKIPTSELSNMFDHYEKLRKPAATANLNQGRSTANLTLNSGTIKSWCFRTAISWLPNSLLSSFLFKADEQNNPALIECGLEPCRVSLFS